MRGEIYNIDGHSFFAMGGASSHDIEFRTENISWWKDELPNDKEYENAFKNLEKHNNKIDFIISHCCSDNVQNMINSNYVHDKLTNFFRIIDETVEFKKWFFGHYHIDRDFGKYRCLFEDVIKI